MSDQRFSFSYTAHEFVDHIGKSIRGYHELRDDIVGNSRYFVENDTAVVDNGCSEGSMIRRNGDANDQAPDAQYVGVEINDAFQQHWRTEPNLTYKIEDIRESYSLQNLSLTISMLTFQFLPERDRLSLMQKYLRSSR